MLLLLVGNKNYSSWSLRPWLAMKVLGIPFQEKRIPLYVPGAKEEILRHSPGGKVPVLIHEKNTIWDSLAILEYLAELHPGIWPAERAARAQARSISAEMHAGFPHLRNHMSMNIRKRFPGKGRNAEVLSEIKRINEMWSTAKGPFLFGNFCAADAMYAPVVLRFRTYEVEPENRKYYDTMLALPAMKEWIAAAERETESLPQFEPYA
jgi:glutathione S-transferase